MKKFLLGHHHCMSMWIYDYWPHPPHLYTRVSSAYSGLVQLYTRLGQLLTASGMVQKRQVEDSRCRYGCKETEDMYHVFVRCRRFNLLRLEVVDVIVLKVMR